MLGYLKLVGFFSFLNMMPMGGGGEEKEKANIYKKHFSLSSQA